MIQISKKGRDFYGLKLTSCYFDILRLVVYKKSIYVSGKCFNDLISLCDSKGNDIHFAAMRDVKLIVCGN